MATMYVYNIPTNETVNLRRTSLAKFLYTRTKQQEVSMRRNGGLGMLVLALSIFLLFAVAAGAETLTVQQAREQWEQEKGEMRFWTIEDQCAFWLQYGDEPVAIPKTDEIHKTQALELAGQALQERYGIPAGVLEQYRIMERYEVNETTLADGWYTFVWLDENHRDEAMRDALYSVAVRAADGEILLVERRRDMAGSVPRTVDWQDIEPGDAVRLSRPSGEKIPILEEPWLPSLPAAERFLPDGAVAGVVELYDGVQAVLPDSIGPEYGISRDLWLKILYEENDVSLAGYVPLDYAQRVQ